MRVLAPGKINLHLRVGPARVDGYHSLLSWMCTIGLYDQLTFEPNEHQRHQLLCDDLRLPRDESNLVLKAIAALSETVRAGEGQSVGGLTIALEKNIPSAAGLGGGSSDAARTLLALNRLWRLDRTLSELLDLAAAVGSDVPFFLHAPSALCTGRGETVSILRPPAVSHALLILPGIGLSTAEVYRRFDAMGLGDERPLHNQPDWQSLGQFSAMQLLPLLRNDLEAPAFAIAPQLGDLRHRIEKALERPVRMSGSGSSLFTLFDDEASAAAAARRIGADYSVRALAVPLAPAFSDDLEEK